MSLPKRCPYCGILPDCVYVELNTDCDPVGLVLCFHCMRILSAVGLPEVRERVSGEFIEQAVLEHNANCVERRD